MQFKFKQDFFERPLLVSDQNEVLELIDRYQNADFAISLKAKFAQMIKSEASFLRVFLNSNGMIFGVVLYFEGMLQVLAFNPNFRGAELKDVLFQELKKWAIEHTGGTLVVAPKLISGDWRAFFAKAGVKFELAQNEVKSLSFH